MIALEPGAAGAFMSRLGPRIDATFGRPRAIVVMSPHTATRVPCVLGGARHETVHDFGGFPPALYEVVYDAPGEPELARRVAALLAEHDAAAQLTPQGGLDHGIWTTLMHMYPQGEGAPAIPVVPVSLTPNSSPAHLMDLGRALASLRNEGVLVMGTGSLTHNLRRFFTRPAPVDAPEHADCAAFRAWVHARTQASDWAALLDYRNQAPHALEMHPTDDHWLPFYFAAGAGVKAGETTPAAAVRLHASVTHGHMAMDAYGFGEDAALLAEA